MNTFENSNPYLKKKNCNLFKCMKLFAKQCLVLLLLSSNYIIVKVLFTGNIIKTIKISSVQIK